ncbi:MAG: hypothetical protein H3C34_17950 [Caldilineaceae bacterium]|nr:hypothetical protein [Caldilineaceae bacterium]
MVQPPQNTNPNQQTGQGGTGEDRRAAVNVSITLSSQLIAAALAGLTVLAAYVAYVLSERETPPVFGISALLAAAAFIASIFVAGRAITASRDRGFAGDWSLAAGKSLYNLQALLCIGGILLFGVVLLASGAPRAAQLERTVQTLEQRLEQLEQEVKMLESSQSDTNQTLGSYGLRIEDLTRRADQLDARYADLAAPQ